MSERISIVFPALNEKARLIPTLKEYYSVFGSDVEYIVVDNGSTGGTEAEFAKLIAEIETYDMVIASRWLANSRMGMEEPPNFFDEIGIR